MTALLEARGICVSFDGVQALQEVNISVGTGELVGLIGPNGAGKTTLLHVIAGIINPQRGDVFLDRRSLTGLSTDRRVLMGLGISRQLVRPFYSMSVRENVELAAGAAGMRNPLTALVRRNSRAERRQSARILALVGLEAFADKHPGDLPLGMRKRLEMAKCLAHKPRLLLLDEPLAGLPQTEARALADTIARLQNERSGIVVIEHNLGEVLRICSRMVVMDNGRCLKTGAPERVMADARVRAAYLGEGHAGTG